MKITVEVGSKGQARLIETMAEKLRRGNKKSLKWTNMSPIQLLNLMNREADELAASIGFSPRGMRIPQNGEPWKEAADVANFAAMVADRATSSVCETGDSHE